MMTIEQFCDRHRACLKGREWALANCRDLPHAWETLKPEWLIWVATRPGVLDDRTLRKFAVWSARRVQHLMTDPRSITALDEAERHADGLATDKKLAATRDTVQAAALAAAWAAAGAAAGAAWADARDAARDAAWTAAWAAAGAAQAAWLRENATPNWEAAR